MGYRAFQPDPVPAPNNCAARSRPSWVFHCVIWFCHASQVGEPTEEGEARARERFAAIGKRIGVAYAEQFKLIELPG